MTWHGKQSETKQSKNKTLDVPVNIGVTLCQRRLNRLLQSAEKIWTYWHENLGALRQSLGWIVTMCFPCAPETLCMWRCAPPPEQGVCWNIILAFEVGLSLRVEKQSWTGGCIVEQWRLLQTALYSQSRSRVTGSLILDVNPSSTSLKCTQIRIVTHTYTLISDNFYNFPWENGRY